MIPSRASRGPTMVDTADIALQYHQQGLYAEAAEAYAQAIDHDPAQPELLFNQAAALAALGQRQQAMRCLREAVDLKPDYAEAFYNLGNLQKQTGQFSQARLSYEQAIRYRPRLLAAHYNLANLLRDQEEYGLAVGQYRCALDIDPRHVNAWIQLGKTLRKQGRVDQALQCYEEALLANPHCPELHSQLGMAQADRGDYDAAHASLRQALRRTTRPAGVHCNLGALYNLEGRYAEAVDQYERALLVDRNHAMARWNRALLLLQRGEFREGWQQYQWRHNTSLMGMAYASRHDAPTWIGLPYRGQRLLVHYEQGYGDLFQFARYLPWAKTLGGSLLFEAPASALGLFETWSCIDTLIAASPKLRVAPSFDIQCSLLDLPHLARTTLDTIPGRTPYLHASPERVRQWSCRFTEPGFRVGVVWGGSPIGANRLSTLKLNACRLADLGELTKVPSIRLYGLQKGPAAEQVNEHPHPILLRNLGPEFHTYMDTAAAIAHLDLVLSVDTSVAHLAAAMGKPTWLLLRHESEWRWLLDRADSPWYPTMRLFRQTKNEGWAPVIRRVCERLNDLHHASPPAGGES